MIATTIEDYTQKITNALPFCLQETDISAGLKYRGKVRDTYDLGDKLLLITTDRQSAFDRVLANVPFKGQVLNLASAWWFEQTAHIIPNHVIAIPDPNVTIAKKCQVFPIEFVVRGYITGTTNTSLWTQYNNGVRNYCGNVLPEGLRKNQRLEKPLLTPTTKEEKHDRPISPEEIISEGWMTEADWLQASRAAMALYEFGVKTARAHGLILVDTKYEMGKDADGNIVLIDEIHTPDSSRYWLASTFEERFANAKEPENIDKEFLRLWFIQNCDPYKDAELPKAPDELITTLSARYIQLFEMITGTPFHF
ncbi:MAG TPA: phosphoribosylaminoimidazolesuccinocarboxamide synthase, partial [Gammaproteobacteria bacterium]|nr:phosphoribosylaminoimidazolesuccinocarboxamide synthase [Gammaproteobacteria bacterium]